MKTKKELGLFSTVMMGLSGAIGFEIFVLMDYAYFRLAGPNMVWALLLAGLINLLIMLSYCELSAAMPKVGGEYTYVKVAYGGFIAFVSGCFRWVASVFGAALAAVSFTRQLVYFFSIITPVMHDFVLTYTKLIAMSLVMIFAALDIKGAKKVGSLIVLMLLTIFAIFIASGVSHGLSPPETFPSNFEGLPGVFAATVYMFPMFYGMRALVASAPRVKNPEKNIPKGILLSASLILLLYISLAYTAAGVISPKESPETPFLDLAAGKILGDAGKILFSVAGMMACLSALGTSLTVQSSIIRGISRDGYLPKVLLSVHRRFGTPYIAIIIGSLFVMLLSVVEAIEALGYAASFASLILFIMVNFSLLKLRKEKPYMERPFKIPLYSFISFAGIILSVVLMVFPMLLEDVNAESALMSSIGLTALVLMMYYLRMIGRYRVRIAVGGVGLGMGISIALLTYLAEVGFMPPIFPFIPGYVMLLISIISIIASILNINV